MIEWLVVFIPLWILSFFIGFFSARINKFFEEPKAFVLHRGIEITTPTELEELLFRQKG
jgi:hypothetical protein|tara:strand:+ start:9728 stop:9904 length:177 start_codon:yes stop_codon:yes gene_type:complete